MYKSKMDFCDKKEIKHNDYSIQVELELIPNYGSESVQDERDQEPCLSSHIEELTNDIEQLKNTLLEPNRKFSAIRNSCSSIDPNYIFGKDEFTDGKYISKFKKQQEELMKAKLKIIDYQRNNEIYLNEIKILKEKLENNNNKKTELNETNLNKESKRKIEELGNCLNDSKNLILNLKSKCTKLKQDKKELSNELKEKALSIEYIKSSIISLQVIDLPLIIKRMIQLITNVESEAKELISHVKIFDEEENIKSNNMEGTICLEKEIKQICSCISNLYANEDINS